MIPLKKSRLILTCVLLSLLLPGCASREKKAARAFAEAEASFAAGQWEHAEIQYRNALQLDPANKRTVVRLGQMYLEQGRIGLSVPFLMRAKEWYPNDPELRILLVKLHLGIGNLPGAREEIKPLISAENPSPDIWPLFAESVSGPKESAETRSILMAQLAKKESAPLHFALALLDLRERRVDDAASRARKALALDPKYAPAHSVQAMIQVAMRNAAAADTSFQAASLYAAPRSPLRIRYAQFKIDQGDLAAGKKLLREVTEQTPDYLPPWLILAQLAAKEFNLDEASTLVTKVLAKDSTHPEAILLHSRILLAKGDYPTAVSEMERALRLFPKFPRFHHQMALAYVATGDHGKAVTHLNQALALSPGYPDATILLATLQLNKGDTAVAATGLKALLKQRPELIQAWLLLADVYRTQGALAETLEVFTQVERIFPGNPRTPLMKGQVLMMQKKFKEARLAFEESLSRDPDSMAAIEQLVALDLASKNVDGALARVTALIQKDPKRSAFQQLLAQIYASQKDFTKAEAALLKAIELQPDSISAYSSLAGLYATNDRLPQALENYRKVAKQNPKDSSTLLLIGMLEESLGKHQEALATYEKLLAQNPKNGVAQNNAAWLYISKFNQPDKALAAAQKARELLPQQPQVADTLGWVLYQKKQYAWSYALLRECAEKIPNSVDTQQHLGFAAYMHGDEVAARAALTRTLELNPNHADAPEIKRRLHLLAIDPLKAGDPERTLLEQSLAQNPDDPIALVRLATLHERTGQPGKAIEAYLSVLKASPQNVNAMVQLTRLHAQKGDFAKALELGKAARKLAPDNALLLTILGQAAYRAKEYDWSFSLLQDAARKTPEDPALQHSLALSAYVTGRVAEAETALQAALDLGSAYSGKNEVVRLLEIIRLTADPARLAAAAATVEKAQKEKPEEAPTLMAAAMLAEARRQTDVARKGYEKLLELYPEFSPARRGLALLIAEFPGEQEKAFELVTKARSAFPGDASLARAQGILQCQRGDFSRAAATLKESAVRFPNDAATHYYLGVALLRQKNRDSGRQALDQALKLNLKPELAAEARKLLAESN